jgi:type II secretory pathway pseudopilin PulG
MLAVIAILIIMSLSAVYRILRIKHLAGKKRAKRA